MSALRVPVIGAFVVQFDRPFLDLPFSFDKILLLSSLGNHFLLTRMHYKTAVSALTKAATQATFCHQSVSHFCNYFH